MIRGKWHPKGSAEQLNSTLHLDGSNFVLSVDDSHQYEGDIHTLRVSDRLGNVPRRLVLEDGSVFHTGDNDAIDGALKKAQPIHRLESHLSLAAVALLVTVFLGFSFLYWGLPWVSQKIAYALPDKTNEIIAASSFKFLNEYIFDESKLDPQTKEKIRDHFIAKIMPLDKSNDQITYTLHFREWKIDGEGVPNALALPSGDIILTDQLVELSNNQDEIDSVLLHEMAHVVYRHTLITVVQSTIISTILVLIAGDTSGFADMGLGVGSFLVTSHYSRENESQADQYAFNHMLAQKIDPQAFSNIMRRMEDYMEREPEKAVGDTGEDVSGDEALVKTTGNQDAGDKDIEKDSREDFIDYFSSHPNTRKRIAQAERYAECFKLNKITCPESGAN